MIKQNNLVVVFVQKEGHKVEKVGRELYFSEFSEFKDIVHAYHNKGYIVQKYRLHKDIFEKEDINNLTFSNISDPFSIFINNMSERFVYFTIAFNSV